MDNRNTKDNRTTKRRGCPHTPYTALSMEGYGLRRRHVGHTTNRRYKTDRKFVVRRTVSVFAAAALTVTAWNMLPQIKSFMYKATLVSAAMTVPDAAVEMARQRFEEELLEHSSDGDEQSVPYENGGTSSQSEPQEETESQSKEETDNPDTPPAEFEVSEEKQAPPIDDIPEEIRGVIAARHYEASNGGAYIQYKNGLIKNSTDLSREKVQEYLDKPLEMTISDTDEPQVLIMHTHATESYAEYDAEYYDKRNAAWRTRDNEKNVVRLGQIITDELNKAGIVTLHDETQHDYPSYNGSYQRSEVTVKKYLEQYPSIKVVIDVHRDAIQAQDGTVYKAVSDINGEKTAQVMIISGCDDGTMGMPEWDKNLRFAAALQNTMETKYPGLTRPILFDYRKYNQHLTNGSLLLEFGSHGNTLAECERTAYYVAQSMIEMLNGLKK